jgi:hypothetical protein
MILPPFLVQENICLAAPNISFFLVYNTSCLARPSACVAYMQACYATCINMFNSGHKKRRTPALLQIHFDFSLSAAIKSLMYLPLLV